LSVKDLENIEEQAKIEKLRQAPHVLHPAGGLTENFVYEPISVGNYVYKTKKGVKGIAELQVEFEEEERKKKPHWFLDVEGEQLYFVKRPPKDFLFNMLDRGIVEEWVKGEKQSLTTRQLWNLNSVYLRTFLDFPHKYEFNISLLFIQQSWLAEILPVVFYLGIRGEFGGGKTVTGEAISLICKHGYLTGNLSPPFVARTIQDQKITLMVDELDTIAGSKDSDLNAIFRQGYRRGSKYSRINPDTLEPESFDIFGPKVYTVHSEIEEALQTRTIPIHVRETADIMYPIVNLDKKAFANMVFSENFLWYLDNIIELRDNQFEKIQSLNVKQLDILPALDRLRRGVPPKQEEEVISNIRTKIYEKKRALLTEAQVKQVSQVTGRNTELMFLCLTISNMVNVDVNEDLKKTFEQKLVEEGERTELGYLGMLRDILTSLWNEKQGKTEYTTADGYVKISNKELYDKYNEKMKKEYGQGVSPAKFKGYMLEFGFTDALNRKKLEVPVPGNQEAKSRLCNIFTGRVLRKLGVEKQEKSFGEQLKEIRDWVVANKGLDGLVDGSELAGKIKEFELDPQKLVEKLREEGFIFEVPEMGKWGVNIG